MKRTPLVSSALPLPDMAATCVPPKAKNKKKKVPTNSPDAATRWAFSLGHLSLLSASSEAKGRGLLRVCRGMAKRVFLPLLDMAMDGRAGGEEECVR